MVLADIELKFLPAEPWDYPVFGPLALCLTAVVLVALTLATYRGTRVSKRRLWTVVALRLLALLLAMLTVLRPYVRITETDDAPSTLVFALDGSQSMTVPDAVNGRTRWDEMKRQLELSARAIDDLRERHRVAIEMRYFADRVEKTRERPDGPSTDFGELLDAVTQEFGRRGPIRGLIVLSDGADNSGLKLGGDGLDARARESIRPIYTFLFGKSSKSDKDIEVAEVSPRTDPVSVKGKLVIDAKIKATGFANATVVARVLFDGKEVSAKDVVLRNDGDNQIELTVDAPATPGDVKLSVKVDPRAGESSVENNEYSTFITVTKEGLSILVIDRLRIELKYIRRALAGDPRFRVFEVNRQTDDAPRGAAAELYRFDQQAYDVIIIGDVSAQRLQAGDRVVLDKIEELVREKGVGLLMLGGEESFAAGGWATNPVGRALPVRMNQRGQFYGDVRMLPATGMADDYLLRIGTDPAASAALWQRLPMLPGYSLMGERKDNATVVGQAPDGTPLLVRKDYGNGRTVALALDMTYLWQQFGMTQRPPTTEGIDAHARFWRQMMLYLGKQDKSDGSVWVKLDQRRLKAGDPLPFRVGARGKTGLELAGGTFKVNIKNKKDEVVGTVTTTAEGAAERGVIPKTLTDAPGEFSLEVDGEAKDQDGSSVRGRSAARFLIYRLGKDEEMRNTAAKPEFLERLAEVGKGRSFRDAAKLPEFLEELQHMKIPGAPISSRDFPNWLSSDLGLTSPIIFMLFVLVLGLEWGLRRWWGMA